MKTTTLKKTVYLGEGDYGRTFCKITISEDKDMERKMLSICGVEGPKANGDCKGSCGQIHDSILINTFADGWDSEKLAKFINVWEKWHLNDMNAGTPKQKKAIEEWEKNNRYDFEEACKHLTKIGVYVDKHNGENYRYGTQWLYEEIPTEVLEFLENLPESKVTPAWV